MIPSRSLLRLLTLVSLVALTQVTEVSAQVGGAGPPDMATIRAVRFHVEPGQTRVWFETTGPVLYTHYSPDPLTLVVDLPGVDIAALSPRTVVGSREVESVLATSLDGVNGKKLSRIEIKLAALAPYKISGSEQALNIVFDGVEVSGSTPSSSPETLVAAAPVAAAPAAAPERQAAMTPPPPSAAKPEEALDEIRGQDIAPSPKPAPQSSSPAHPASAINGITHELVGDVLRVKLFADGRLNYTSFVLEAPKRLVFDFNGVLNAVSRAAVTIEELGVSRVRVAQFRTAEPRITRVVFDLDDEVTHRAVAEDGGLQVAFARSEAAFQSPALAAMDDASVAEAPAKGTILIENSNGTSYGAVVQNASYSPSEPSPTASGFEPVTLTAQDLTASLASPAPSLPTPPPPTQGPPQPANPQIGGQTVIMPGSQELGTREYTGELISLDFKDGDIQDIFRLFADISGLNIVVQPGVSGRITLKLVEVPWDQALELILKTNKLGYIVEGNVIRIAPLAELAAEEAERRRLAEEKALAGDLFTQTRVLSYSKASELQELLQRNLSPRGDIVIDERTNTVIYTDLAEQVAAINQLIDTLDTPIPGVEIEARIVVTTRTFARQLGVQWGFSSNQIQTLGNTTELVFPNRVQLDGQAIGSQAERQFNAPPAEGGLIPPQQTEGADPVQRGYAVNLPFAGVPTGAVGLSLGSISGAFSIDAAISAAERRGQVRIISAPKIITQNNKAAEIKQGVTFPVQVVANNTITVQFKDAVLDLSVTPQITSADTIILDIEVNNDSLDFGRQVNGIPSIITQAATTQVLVDDGSTTVIGGVFVNTQQNNETYVPLLHRIPILGYLFKAKSTDTRNEELLIFLTPRIRKETV
ncbi:MAG TPA: type IV pilus secretin PilQ [Vicinamibacteria bacterium]|nr:type IV pilus secretin PilQ [Vicinamibacteria bacterium]